MDLLFKRYASPFSFSDGMIRTARFSEFVTEVVRIYNEETDDKSLWECWLHKSYEKTFNEFIADNTKPQENMAEEIDFEATINQSFEILQGFKPC